MFIKIMIYMLNWYIPEILIFSLLIWFGMKVYKHWNDPYFRI